MLSIQNSDRQKCTPHLLPARINHNGRIDNTSRYWAPTIDDKGTQHVHFRGRHLHGTSLPLPASHTGAMLIVTDKPAPQTRSQPREHAQSLNDDDDEEMEQDRPEEVKIAEQVGEFDEVVVWGHGGTVDGESDIFVRGIREWVGFAESMHCDEGEGDGVKVNAATAS